MYSAGGWVWVDGFGDYSELLPVITAQLTRRVPTTVIMTWTGLTAYVACAAWPSLRSSAHVVRVCRSVYGIVIRRSDEGRYAGQGWQQAPTVRHAIPVRRD
ncbi:hypothetical protein SEVIR_2G394551v4 [Setaria viridis]